MSALSVIAGVLALVPKAVRGVAAIVAAAYRPPAPPESTRAIPYNRPHAWGYGLSEPPVCAVCKSERTDANADVMCDGPPPSAVAA